MTAWMAAPPEVHSQLLSAGPGTGSLLAAASGWQALSAEFAAVAAELSAAIAALHGGAWDGAAAERYAAAHLPYLDWLMQTSAKSAGAAAQHEVAAAAYTAAVEAMPALAELAANHAVHGVLVATNFFGINTIPIALNEADYARMWVQAATIMTVYQALSDSARAAVAPTQPAPPVLAAEAAKIPPTDPVEAALAWSEHFSSMYRVLKALVTNPFGTLVQIVADFATNPATALTTWLPLIYVFAYAATFALLGSPIYTVVSAPGFAAIPLALGLSALCVLPETVAAGAAEVPAVVADSVIPVSGLGAAPVTATAGAAPAPGPVQQVPASGTASAPPSIPAHAHAYLVGGPGPGPTSGPAQHNRATASAPASRPAAAHAAAPANTVTAGRRRRAQLDSRGYRDEFMTLDDACPPDEAWASHSHTGAGPLGFTGTARTCSIDAAGGLTRLAGGSFTDAPAVPMMPATWKDGSRRT